MKPIKTGNIVMQLDTKICQGMGIETTDDVYFAWIAELLETPDLRGPVRQIRDFHELGAAFQARLNWTA